MGGLSTEFRKRFINGSHDMQQRSCRLSRDLEHPHQAISSRHRDDDKAGVVGQTRSDRLALGQAAQEIGVHFETGST